MKGKNIRRNKTFKVKGTIHFLNKTAYICTQNTFPLVWFTQNIASNQ